MKRLYFMRHSKAGQTDKHMLNDHERALTKKGEELIPDLTKYFEKYYSDNPPDIILSSTAVRAKQTAALFKDNYQAVKDKNVKIEEYQELYITGDDEVLHVIRNIDDKYNTALIVSHNPGMHNFCLKFANEGDKDKYREMKSNFSPGSFVTFDVDVESWSSVKHETGILLDFTNAKNHKKWF